MVIHYITLHYITLHYITLRLTTITILLQIQLVYNYLQINLMLVLFNILN
jgi:hypothetical protein